ncbi:MAG: putative prolyl oligopeptidase family protein [Candidatus Sulfotelmatobacter sp.]|nr:putative prolyl oligopeptidase family protein [Candidatus Sulfotelmatobacter sp.]
MKANFWDDRVQTSSGRKLSAENAWRKLWRSSALLVLSAVVSPPRVHATTEPNRNLRPFTVADSIEMTHFVSPPEQLKGVPPDFSPDRKSFLIVTEKGNLKTNTRDYTLLRFDVDHLSAGVSIATFRSSSNRAGIVKPVWLDNESISFIGENPGDAPQVYMVNCRSGKLKKLTSDPLGVEAYDISRDRKTIAFLAHAAGSPAQIKYREEHGFAVEDESLADLTTGNWKQPPDVCNFYVKRTSSSRAQRIGSETFFCLADRPHIWLSPDGRYAVTEKSPRSAPPKWAAYEEGTLQRLVREQQGRVYKNPNDDLVQAVLVNTTSATLRPLVDSPISKATSLTAAWSSDSHSVVVGNIYLPLDQNDQEELTRRKVSTVVAEVDVPSLAYRRIVDLPKDETWKLRASDSANSFLVDVWKVSDGNIYKKLAPRKFLRQGSEWAQGAEYAEHHGGDDIAVSQSLGHWPKLVRVDPEHKTETVILDSNPEFKNVEFGRIEVIHWTGERGEPLIGGLVYPTHYRPGKRYPLVIQTHGFNPDTFLTDGPFTTAFAAQEFANKDMAVLQVGESSLYEHAQGTADFGPVNMSQLESAVDYLDRLGVIDRECVGLVGFSVTGFQVIYTLANSKYHFKAATSSEGNDWGYWSYIADGNRPEWQAQVEAPYGGAPWENGWKPWMDHSISFNFDKIHTPLRIESDNNSVAEVLSEWEKLIALKILHKPVELIFETSGDHPVVKPWDRMTSQQGNVDWIAFWLKGDEDPDAAKQEQYLRWREMRKLQESEIVKAN